MMDIPLGFYIKDLKGNIIYANHAAAKLMQYPTHILQRKKIQDICTPSQLIEIRNEDAIISKTKRSITIEKNLTFANNENHCFQITKSPILDKKDNVKGFFVLYQDIDSKKTLENNQQSFIETLTHDLKTPTNAQINILNLLLSGSFGKLTSEQFEMITLTHNSCIYMSDLIGTILDTYNSDNGFITLQKEEFDLISTIKELCNNNKILKNKNNLTIKIENICPTCVICADKLQLKRVIMNFLSNAITYSFPNSTIYIHLDKFENNIHLYIKNQSKQIPESELKTIFDKYKQTKFSHFNKTGTGLGLYLSKRVIKLHKGEIYATSDKNGTCIFGFRIPIKVENKIEQTEAKVS